MISSQSMKSAILRTSILLLFALIKVALCNDVGEAVLDKEDRAVIAGVSYYMLLPSPNHGEFGPGKTSNMTCPLSVMLDQANHGELVRISLKSGENGTISTNEDVEISFRTNIGCAESTKWMIVKDRGEDFWSVGLGSARDHPGCEILNGSFKIQKYNETGAYKLMFCSNARVCGYIQVSKNGVLTFGDNDDSAFLFVFWPKFS